MRVFFDNCTPDPIARYLKGHTVTTARRRGWHDFDDDGIVLDLAEQAGFEVFLTGDQNIPYQQRVKGRKYAVRALSTNRWPLIKPYVQMVVDSVNHAKPGSFDVIQIPGTRVRNPEFIFVRRVYSLR